MAGEFSRVSNQRALNTAMWCQGSNAGDQLGTVAAGGLTATTIACSALSRSLPSLSTILLQSTTGTNGEAFVTNGTTASGATSITVVSQTAQKTHVTGDIITMVQVPQAYMALCTAAPADNALGTEYAATGYARQATTMTAPTAADPPATGNSALLTFGPMTAGTGSTISYAMLMDALSGGAAGNMGAWWTLTTAKTPGTNDSVTIASNAATMTCL